MINCCVNHADRQSYVEVNNQQICAACYFKEEFENRFGTTPELFYAKYKPESE